MREHELPFSLPLLVHIESWPNIFPWKPIPTRISPWYFSLGNLFLQIVHCKIHGSFTFHELILTL